jgi:hypothetical protein
MKPEMNGIIFVSDKHEKKQFIDFPYQHYKKEPKWVAPLKLQQKELLDTKNNPFYKDAEIALFLAEVNGKIAGRIASIHNKAYNRFTGENAGFFGFFECVDNQNAANLLFKVAGDWLAQRGLNTFYGPLSPNMMSEIGVLIEGFEFHPSFLMPYNKPYYDKLITNSGFEKHVDLLAYRITKDTVDMERGARGMEIVHKRMPEFKLRRINLRHFKKEVVIIRDIFNAAWAKNWGFAPLTAEEFEYMVKDMKLVIDTDLAYIGEVDGKPVCFSIALPDFNHALKHMDGTLFPTGLFKLLYYKSKTKDLRTVLMGIIPEYVNRGLDAYMNQRTLEVGLRKGYETAEVSWILESNMSMRNVAERYGSHIEKRYRVYKKQ